MIRKSLFVFFLSLTFLMGIEESQIDYTMENKTRTITSILKTSLSSQQKKQKIINSVEGLFDYYIMAKISLGTTWKSLNSSERQTFAAAFKKKLQQTYYSNLELYTDQEITNNPLQKIKSNRITVKSDIKGKDKVYGIIYKFYKERKNNNWLIYDVEIDGVSIIQSHRNQHREFLKTKSFNELVQSLQNSK